MEKIPFFAPLAPLTKAMPDDTEKKAPKHFIQRLIERDRAETSNETLMLRFPPEPNGYLHIGHAKAIYLNFELAKQYEGLCRLRFDDTDPMQEDAAYVEAIERDVRWLGYAWEGRSRYTSDYFSQLYEWALTLIGAGKAYVDKNDTESFNRLYRGTVSVPGKESPYRTNSIAENFALFEQMTAGKIPEGQATLRAKIDMKSRHILLRDPVLYRIKKKRHFKEKDKWCVYPMYDFSHPLSDAIEGVTHSLCTMEFASHRPLYDWFIENLPVPSKPRQIEFSRLNVSHTLTSKRGITWLIKEGHVTGWDDPRLATLAGLRRRGYTPQAIKRFVEKVGISKRDNLIAWSLLEWCLREELNRTALRRLVVLRPIKVVLTNYPEGKEEWLEAVNNPKDPAAGHRSIPFGKHIYVDAEDFRHDPPEDFFRLAVGRDVRLKYAYTIRCHRVAEGAAGVKELHCTYDPASRGGEAQKRVKGVIHWVSAQHSQPATVRLYNPLFLEENPAELDEKRWEEAINPRSVEVLPSARVEPALAAASSETPYQFERLGYFCLQASDAAEEGLCFHRSVSLRDNKKRGISA